jgi:hypothetical protein
MKMISHLNPVLHDEPHKKKKNLNLHFGGALSSKQWALHSQRGCQEIAATASTVEDWLTKKMHHNRKSMASSQCLSLGLFGDSTLSSIIL